jgi:arylsulfatase A-like enzyme
MRYSFFPALRSLCLAVAAAVLWAANPAVAASRPNVVFLTVDDLGLGDLACHGGAAATPHLDALADSGTRFNRHFAAAAAGLPTRLSLLTGCYPVRFDSVADAKPAEGLLPAGAPTLPGLLKAAGYETAHAGWWPTADDPEKSAEAMRRLGFDHFSPITKSATDGVAAPADAAGILLDKLLAGPKPFLLHVWLGGPGHGSSAAPCGGAADEAAYRRWLTRLDDFVGRVSQRLEAAGRRDRTLVVFVGVNGPAMPGKNLWLRGGKGTLFDGGLRTPLIISWPGTVKSARVVEVPFHSADLLPTLCAAVGVERPADAVGDGQDYFTFLRGRGPAPSRRVMHWQMAEQPDCQQARGEAPPHATEVILSDRWKLMCREGRPVALFNIYLDDGEKYNWLAPETPLEEKRKRELEKVVPRLTGELKAWLESTRGRFKP